MLQHTLFTRPHPTPEQLSTLLAPSGCAHGPGSPRRASAGRFLSARRRSRCILPSIYTQKALRSPRPQRPTSTAALSSPGQPVPARVAVDADKRPVRVTTDRRASPAVGDACVGPWRTSGNGGNQERDRPPRAGGATRGRATSLRQSCGGPPKHLRRRKLASKTALC